MPEPFKIKMVEQIQLLPRPQRERLLRDAGYNVFCLRSDQVGLCRMHTLSCKLSAAVHNKARLSDYYSEP